MEILERFVKELSDVRLKTGDDGDPKLVYGLIDGFVKRGMGNVDVYDAGEDITDEEGKVNVKLEANGNGASGIDESISTTRFTRKKTAGGKVLAEDTESNEELAQNQLNSVMIKSTGQKSVLVLGPSSVYKQVGPPSVGFPPRFPITSPSSSSDIGTVTGFGGSAVYYEPMMQRQGNDSEVNNKASDVRSDMSELRSRVKPLPHTQWRSSRVNGKNDGRIHNNIIGSSTTTTVQETTRTNETVSQQPSSSSSSQTTSKIFIKFNRLPPSTFDKFLYTAIADFFKWQYPSVHLFIHRESFLFYYLQNKHESTFVSPCLIYAIATLGACQSHDPELKCKADEYYRISKSYLFNNTGTGVPATSSPPSSGMGMGTTTATKNDDIDGLSYSSITKIQTLLCLAFYDIMRGQLTSCWLLSGLAWRMIFDLGFESDPSSWPLDNYNSEYIDDYDDNGGDNEDGENRACDGGDDMHKKKTKHTKHVKYPFELSEVKRRIYWGCFIADHFISLVLGRKPTLRHSETNVQLSVDMYELFDIHEFRYPDPLFPEETHDISAASITVVLVELSELAESMLSDVFGPIIKKSSTTENDNSNSNVTQKSLNFSKNDIVTRLKYLNAYNNKLCHLNSKLPANFKCSLQEIHQTGHNYVTLGVRSYYILLRLSLNRPFIQLTTGSGNGAQMTSAQICDEAIQEILGVVDAVEKVYGDKFTPMAPLVFCLVLGTSILIWKYSKTYTTGRTGGSNTGSGSGSGSENEAMLLERFKLKSMLERIVPILKRTSGTWKISSEVVEMYRNAIELGDGDSDHDSGGVDNVDGGSSRPVTPASSGHITGFKSTAFSSGGTSTGFSLKAAPSSASLASLPETGSRIALTESLTAGLLNDHATQPQLTVIDGNVNASGSGTSSNITNTSNPNLIPQSLNTYPVFQQQQQQQPQSYPQQHLQPLPQLNYISGQPQPQSQQQLGSGSGSGSGSGINVGNSLEFSNMDSIFSAFNPLMNGDVHDSVFSPNLAVMDWAFPVDGNLLLDRDSKHA
ncbi:unnamed protein product [Ambrosiozyma monospora]|uniref:Unnamed protein product n=1 Tax=Ambrosiozyma monospora TaxID=43982 RepID=A0A9W7DJB7_AMBMO|nr:unnamed protein product [Ambrosiozyma monospora]